MRWSLNQKSQEAEETRGGLFSRPEEWSILLLRASSGGLDSGSIWIYKSLRVLETIVTGGFFSISDILEVLNTAEAVADVGQITNPIVDRDWGLRNRSCKIQWGDE